MARVKTFTNGGSLLPSDLNSVQDDYELAFSSYRTINDSRFVFAGGKPAGTYFANNGSDDFSSPFAFDPADHAAAPRTVKLRLRCSLLSSGTALAADITFALFPVTSLSASPALTIGSAVSGSSVVFSAPSANSSLRSVGSDFTAPAAGTYVIGAVQSATSGGAAYSVGRAFLQLHQV